MNCIIFFFKQKTAYEMRISDWSSDVCSSDLSDTAGAGARSRGDRGNRANGLRTRHDPRRRREGDKRDRGRGRRTERGPLMATATVEAPAGWSRRPGARVFSGHESFACRYGWLPKLYEAISDDPALFSSDERAILKDRKSTRLT